MYFSVARVFFEGVSDMVGEMETKEKPKPTPDYLMQLMNDKKLMSSLPNFCGIFNHLERLLDEGERISFILMAYANRLGQKAVMDLNKNPCCGLFSLTSECTSYHDRKVVSDCSVTIFVCEIIYSLSSHPIGNPTLMSPTFGK